jgi:hypothetical protein
MFGKSHCEKLIEYSRSDKMDRDIKWNRLAFVVVFIVDCLFDGGHGHFEKGKLPIVSLNFIYGNFLLKFLITFVGKFRKVHLNIFFKKIYKG